MSKFDELKRIYPRDKATLDRLEKKVKHATILVDIRDHKAIEWIEAELVSFVHQINEKLLSNESLSELERECLLTDRERCEWFLDIFPTAEKTLKLIEEKLQKAYDKKRFTR